MNAQRLDKMCYEYALKRVEDLLPQVGEDMPANDPLAMELAIMSDYVIATIKEIKANLVEAVRLYVETCHDLGCDLPEALKGEYQIVFSMDVKSLLTLYQGIFTKAGLEKLTGINQKQLWHYASGISTPRKAQVLKIEKAIHRLGQELLSIQL